MSTQVPALNGQQKAEDQHLEGKLANLSLSSKTIHTDDFLNVGQDVAPPMHVSTTFRYSSNPDDLIPHADVDVRLPFQEWEAQVS